MYTKKKYIILQYLTVKKIYMTRVSIVVYGTPCTISGVFRNKLRGVF